MATQPQTIEAEPSTVEPVDLEQQQYPGEQQAPVENEASDELPSEQGDEELEGEQQEELPPIDAPRSWSKEAKEQFGSLPREAQEIIAKRETERDRFVEQKATEAQRVKQETERQAREAVQQVFQAHAAQLQQYAQMFEVPPPDIRLLQSGDEQHRALYYQQDAAYKSAAVQREQAQREADQARQQSEALEQQSLREQAAHDLNVLQEQLPEWSEPSERAKLLTDLESIGAELGYSPEQMTQARASDILALHKARSWKADAEKYRQLMKRKMEPVRAARTLPPVARPGVPGAAARGASADIAETLYPNDVRK